MIERKLFLSHISLLFPDESEDRQNTFYIVLLRERTQKKVMSYLFSSPINKQEQKL